MVLRKSLSQKLGTWGQQKGLESFSGGMPSDCWSVIEVETCRWLPVAELAWLEG
jgi:hypothetical protein